MTGDDRDADTLNRFRHLPRSLRILRTRLRLAVAIVLGVAAFLLLPGNIRTVSRALIAWDIAVSVYLVAACLTIARTDVATIRRHATEFDDGRFAVLVLTAAAALASLGAIIAEIGGAGRDAWQIALVVATITLSWTLIHTTFALHYAHDYYRTSKPGGLVFPDEDRPDYWDFVYFSFVIGMTAQVSDVGISDRIIRRTATAHGVVSFVFNTTLLALTVNLAASAL
ncbi:MAG: DUF1345 domain-containing protein [Xanthobacteraceae bacterium]